MNFLHSNVNSDFSTKELIYKVLQKLGLVMPIL